MAFMPSNIFYETKNEWLNTMSTVKLIFYTLGAEGQLLKMGKCGQLLTMNFNSNPDY